MKNDIFLLNLEQYFLLFFEVWAQLGFIFQIMNIEILRFFDRVLLLYLVNSDYQNINLEG